MTHGLDDLDGPPGLVEPLKAAFERKTAPGGGWTAHSTVAQGANAVKRFVREIMAADPGVTAIGDITPEVWRAWYGFGLSSGNRLPISSMRALLLEVVGLPEPTVEAVRGRRRFMPHGEADERAFRDASWLVAEATITRIGGNGERVARYRAGEKTMDEGRARIKGREWGIEDLADYVFRHGVLPGRLTTIPQKQLYGLLQVPRKHEPKAALFPIVGEIAALQFLFVLEGGYSPLALRGMKVGAFGAERHEDPEALTAEAAAVRLGRPVAAKTRQAMRQLLHRIAEFVGRPARDWLAARGRPTDALFVAYASGVGRFTTDWSKFNPAVAAASWVRLTGIRAQDGAIPSLARIRTGGPAGDETRILVRAETDAGIVDYDFSDLAYLPSLWVEAFCVAFERLTGPGGAWHAKDVALAGSGILRRLARDLPATNPGLTMIDDITKEIWEQWRNAALLGSGGSRTAVDLAQSLLHEAGWLGGADAALLAKSTAAALPGPGWQPVELVGEGGLHGWMPGTAGLMWDFRDVEAPLGLKKPIAAAFAQRAGIGGMWKSSVTVRDREGTVRRFLRSFASANPDIATTEDITPESWWSWLGEGHASHPPTPNDIAATRALLVGLDGLRETTRQALISHRLPPRNPSGTASYTARESRALRAASVRDVREAARRIARNLDRHELYLSGKEPAGAVRIRIAGNDYTHGALVHHLMLHGTMPGYRDPGPEAGDVVRDMLGLAEGQPYTNALFLTGTQVLSLQMLFVLEGGYNDSTLKAMTVGNYRADDRESDPPVEVREHDKPRRGSRRFFSETLMGDLQKLHELAEWITQPGRDARAALGNPTDALWVETSAIGGSKHPTGRFLTNWSKGTTKRARRWSEQTGVTDNTGGHPQMRRLRRTHLVTHDKPMGNTQATLNDEYLVPDPRTREHARDTIPRVQGRIVRRARMRVLSHAEAAATPRSDDTGVVACSDILHSPFAEPGELCPVSLRMCFECPNAYIAPHHLPRVTTYMSELKAVTGHLSDEEWQNVHGDTYAQLQDATGQFTEAELSEARGSVTSDDVTIVRAVLRLP